MKRNIRLGDRCALTKHNLKRFKIRYISRLAVATIMCLYAVKQVSAQEAEPVATAVSDIKPLQIGDTIPDVLWQLPLQVVNHPEGKDTIMLNDYRNKKLIILDFWATWCVPCIKSLDKLDSLKRHFANDLAVIPITYEAEGKSEALFKQKGWSLFTAVQETTLKNYFQHRSIPHQIWIRDRIVVGVTGAEYTSKENIAELINSPKLTVNTKDEDMLFDKLKPLLIDGNGGGADRIGLQSLVSKRIPVRMAGISYRKNGIMVYNMEAFRLYMEAFASQIPFGGHYNRVVFRVDSASKFALRSPHKGLTGALSEDTAYFRWLEENTYCYNLVLPKAEKRAVINRLMQDDLNRFFGYRLGIVAEVLPLRRKCLLLKIKDTKLFERKHFQTRETKNGTHFSTMRALTAALQLANSENPLCIINETGFDDPVSVVLTSELDDLEQVKIDLDNYGLGLEAEYRNVDMLVFSKVEEGQAK